jgi:hypothetical protein
MVKLYTVEVGVSTHDDLKASPRPPVLVSRVRLALDINDAPSRFALDALAVATACQMAACTSGMMPVFSRLLDFPLD